VGVLQQQTVTALLRQVERDPVLRDALQETPRLSQEALELAAEEPAYIGDRLLYRAVVATLGLVVLITVIGYLLLAALGKAIPDGLIGLAAAAVGGLVGLFAKPPAGP